VEFRIPTIEELGLGESTIAEASLADEEVADVAAASPSAGGSGKQPADSVGPSKEQQIEFLCPNGHHLHGPASLQGRAGECPECGSRFRIPVIDEPEVEAEVPAGSHVATQGEIALEDAVPVAELASDPAAQPLDFLQVMESGSSGPVPVAGGSGGLGGPIINLTSGPDGAVLAAHPLAVLFIELWAARGEGSRVEVHLESGSVLVPDGYLKSHSQQDYAVLVTRDPDGCSTITVVPWNSISRIILRAVKEVPGEVVR
jgi:hypothetical protein